MYAEIACPLILTLYVVSTDVPDILTVACLPAVKLGLSVTAVVLNLLVITDLS